MTAQELQKLRKKAGVFPSIPDPRDYPFEGGTVGSTKLVSLKKHRGAILSQGSLNSCTGHGTAGMLNLTFRRITGLNAKFNPYWIWYHARKSQGFEKLNEGAFLRDVFKHTISTGVIDDRLWNPKDKRTAYKDKPPIVEEHDRIKFKAYYSINFMRPFDYIKQDIFYCIGEEGLPVGVTLAIHPYFHYYRGGDMKIPSKNDPITGWHWLYAEGADEDGIHLVNSWGTSWGNKGTCHLPWDYLRKFGQEAWTFDKELP